MIKQVARRDVLIGTGAACAAAMLPFDRALATDRSALAEEAFIWGMPLVQFSRLVGVSEKAACRSTSSS